MSGGITALFRTSLCGVVMALTVLSTGCAIEAASDAEADDITEVADELTVAVPTAPGGLVLPKGPPAGPEVVVIGIQAKSTNNGDELMEPEPEPWKPDGRIIAVDPNPMGLSTTPDHSVDHK